jgi:CheY-like chemotaxis protein
MNQEEIDELKDLTDQLNKHDAEVILRLDTLTADLHQMSLRIHNDLQILMGVLYVEEKHAENGGTAESLHNVKEVVLGISEHYSNTVGVVQTTKTRIMIVEDEPSIFDYLKLVMDNLGYEVVGHADNGDDAVRIAIEQQPDIILMDISLEGSTSGIDAACEIRKRTNIPVIFATGRIDVDVVSESRRAKPEGYLVKPFSIDQIYATIELALTRRGKRNRGITPQQ